MATDAYRKLIDDVCALAKIPNPQSFYASADLIIEEVAFTLTNASEDDKDEFMAMYCDFGLLPGADRAAILERLLEKNLDMHGHGINTPVFMLNAETNHVLLGLSFPIAQLKAQELTEYLGQYAEIAKLWRGTYFLEGKESKQGKTARASNHEKFKKKFAK